eukprot:1621758-Alexandrium_andersonii.AAC.1
MRARHPRGLNVRATLWGCGLPRHSPVKMRPQVLRLRSYGWNARVGRDAWARVQFERGLAFQIGAMWYRELAWTDHAGRDGRLGAARGGET